MEQLFVSLSSTEPNTASSTVQWFSNFSSYQNHLSLLKQIAATPPSESGSIDLKCGLIICISKKFSGGIDATGLGTTLKTTAGSIGMFRHSLLLAL